MNRVDPPESRGGIGKATLLRFQARVNQGACGQPRRHRMDARRGALGKRLALVLCRLSESKSLRVGGLVDGGWGLQPGGSKGP